MEQWSNEVHTTQKNKTSDVNERTWLLAGCYPLY